MSGVVIKLFGGKLLETDETQGRMVALAINASPRPQFVMVDGNSVAVADITGIYTSGKWAEMSAAGDARTIPEPVPAVGGAPKSTAPEWMWDQKAELDRRFVAGQKPGPGLWWAWIADETQFRAVMAGETEWPVMEARRLDKPGTSYRWKRKLVSERQYLAEYAGRPGYRVLERTGTDVVIAYKKPVSGPIRQGERLPAGEAWCNPEEIARLEAASGRN